MIELPPGKKDEESNLVCSWDIKITASHCPYFDRKIWFCDVNQTFCCYERCPLKIEGSYKEKEIKHE